MTKFLTAALPAILLCVAAPPIHATTIDFTYTGVVAGPEHSYGSGSFSFADGLTTLGLGDLTDFTFNLHINNGGSYFNTFTSADLTAFSATIAGGSVTDLSLDTNAETSPIHGIIPENFVVTGLGPLEASNTVVSSGYVVDRGQVTIAAAQTPEPSTWTLMLGCVALAGAWKLRARDFKQHKDISGIDPARVA